VAHDCLLSRAHGKPQHVATRIIDGRHVLANPSDTLGLSASCRRMFDLHEGRNRRILVGAGCAHAQSPAAGGAIQSSNLSPQSRWKRLNFLPLIQTSLRKLNDAAVMFLDLGSRGASCRSAAAPAPWPARWAIACLGRPTRPSGRSLLRIVGSS
jgi:hypothetical protein